MSFLSGLKDLTQLIGGAVGNNLDNKEDDVRTIRGALDDIGFASPKAKEEREGDGKPLGIITRDLDDTIKDFQRDNDLRVDGLIFPGGETETALVQKKKEQEPKLQQNGFALMPPRKPKQAQQAKPLAVDQDKLVEKMGQFLLGKIQEQKIESMPPVPDRKPVSEKYRKEEILKDSENVDIIKAERDAREKIKNFEFWGLDQSAKFLNHYLQGDGKKLKLNRNDIESQPIYMSSIKKNRDRFINESLMDVVSLKDGETKVFKDYWDRDIKGSDGYLKLNPDQVFSTGSVKVRSAGGFTATRNGDIIIIRGDVENKIKDRYDFNKEDKDLRSYRILAEKSNAKEFEIEGVLSEKMIGRIKLNNDKIEESEFTWE